jgi:hypothetical protein
MHPHFLRAVFIQRGLFNVLREERESGNPTGGTPRRLPSLTAESKCLERKSTDNL